MSDSINDPTPAAERVRRGLDFLQRALAGFIALVGSYFVFRYRSDNAVLAGYSWKYLLAVVLPYLLMLLTILRPRCVPGFGNREIRSGKGGRPGAIPGIAASVPAAAGLILAIVAPEPRVAILLLSMGISVSALLWARVLRAAQPLLLNMAPLLLAVLMFGAEIPDLLGGSSTVVWGQPGSFVQPVFPREAPFIGPGGRLKNHLDLRMDAPEYQAGVRLVTNSLGLRNDHEVTEQPAAGVLRILSLGDSFSTGFAAAQDHFFGPLLAESLDCEVLNAEVSDPAYGLRYLQQHGMGLHPEIVIYGLCGNDLMQAYWFAGPGRRFRLDQGQLVANPDYAGDPVDFYETYQDFAYPATRDHASTEADAPPLAGVIQTLAAFNLFSGLFDLSLQYKSLPVITKGFCESYEALDGRLRLLDGAANLGLYIQPTPPPIEEMYTVLFELLSGMSRTAEAAGVRFVLILFPQRHQVQAADWRVMAETWNLDETDFDLEAPNRIIGDYCRKTGIECVDLLERFRARAASRSLYLPGGDVHFNRLGHEIAAQGVADYLNGNGSGSR